ncbi:H-NS family nucleoid-associated regulatory protein [Stenotrophomonas sp.]|uniref:H-NS family nucleoid-associated regulatory protein n=1 Tax=Stenotrophomonas sp. TaxID=69392 RepID=UPI00289F5C7C|nr:H-NS family nucleoid-associated regulatory protein [Stenotrophomonas sp.]
MRTTPTNIRCSQRRKIREAIGAKAASIAIKQVKAIKAPRNGLTPRLWLHFNGETWSGRGRPPKAFISWEGTVAHTEWKKRHPSERFPA